MLESAPMTSLVLASSSPRRRQLLALLQLDFTVSAADIDETVLRNETPADYVLRLAETKARVIAQRADADRIILAADTTVVDGRDILGKPNDDEEAFAMLTQLRGRTHQAYTGVALLRTDDGALLTDLSVADIVMRDYSDEEIRAYIATRDPFDKAGAYAIQHTDFHPVEAVRGCYAGVMGLPLCRVVGQLQKLNAALVADAPFNCQKSTDRDCPVYEKIMSAAL